MKKLLFLSLACSLFLASIGLAQTSTAAQESFASGVYYSPAYAYGSGGSSANPLRVSVGTSATGAGTITLFYGYVILPDGRKIYPFTGVPTLPPISVGSADVFETVTPSSVSCATPETPNTCTITATFSNIHGAGSVVASGDGGIQEAINDASLSGGGLVYWTIDPGSVALATGAATTNLGSVKIPTRSVVLGATAYVTTTITGCSGGWSLGHTSGTEFTAANTTLTAGTTTDSSTITPAVGFNATAAVPIAKCTSSNASAGAIHPRLWGYKYAAPAF